MKKVGMGTVTDIIVTWTQLDDWPLRTRPALAQGGRVLIEDAKNGRTSRCVLVRPAGWEFVSERRDPFWPMTTYTLTQRWQVAFVCHERSIA